MTGNKGLLGFLIAVIVAAIGFLIYWFFFRKKTSDILLNAGIAAGSLGGSAASVATNPISSQNGTDIDYTPVNTDKPIYESGEFGSQSVLSNQSEGFKSSPQETLTSGSALSQRTNNPGALFWDGSTNWQGMNKTLTKSGQIIYFDNTDYGIRAQLMTLKNYSKKYGINTLIGITTRYAPYGHGNNDPAAYARALASSLCIDIDTKFDMDVNRNILAAIGYYIHRIEAGYFFISRQRYLDWSVKV